MRVLLLLIITNLLFSGVDQVVNSYSEKDYEGVLERTNLISEPGSEAAGYYFLYRGVALYNLEKYSFAIKTLEQFISIYGDSESKDLALQYLAMSYYRSEEYIKSVDILDKLTFSKDSEIAKNSLLFAKKIVESRCDISQLRELKNLVVNQGVYDKIKRDLNSLNILVVLPLSGSDATGGKEILRGLNLYIEKNRDRFTKKIRVDVVNSESSIVDMVKKVTKRMENGKYSLVVGELSSQFSGALAGITSAYNTPLIIPVASQKILSEISEDVYQLSSSSYTISSKLAEYAIDSLGYQSFATLCPMSAEGREASDGFINRVIDKGGDIVAQEWYFDSSKLSRQFKRIRENLLIIDSLEVDEYMEPDSIKRVAANGADAFFIPLDFDEMQHVVPQFAFYNFNSKLLGTYGWNDTHELYKISDKVDSLVFGDESSYSLRNVEYIDFTDLYREKYELAPGRLAIRGYDLLRLVHTKLLDSDDIRRSLKELEEYSGISGDLDWSSGTRSNGNVELYLYTRDKGLDKIVEE